MDYSSSVKGGEKKDTDADVQMHFMITTSELMPYSPPTTLLPAVTAPDDQGLPSNKSEQRIHISHRSSPKE